MVAQLSYHSERLPGQLNIETYDYANSRQTNE